MFLCGCTTPTDMNDYYLHSWIYDTNSVIEDDIAYVMIHFSEIDILEKEFYQYCDLLANHTNNYLIEINNIDQCSPPWEKVRTEYNYALLNFNHAAKYGKQAYQNKNKESLQTFVETWKIAVSHMDNTTSMINDLT